MFNGSQTINVLLSNDNSLKKRERTQNWNQEEKERLLELCRKDVQIIENKRYDARHTEAKSKIWQLIHQNFSKQFGSERSVNRLKEQWRRMKAAARSEMQDYKKRMQQCNNNNNKCGLSENKKPTEFSCKVCDLLDEANRLCEQEIPIKPEYNSNILESNNTLLENKKLCNENVLAVLVSGAFPIQENVSDLIKTNLKNDLEYVNDNVDIRMEMKDIKLDGIKNNIGNEVITMTKNDLANNKGLMQTELNRSVELDESTDDSLQICDNSLKNTISDCLSDIENIDIESMKSYDVGPKNNTNKICCKNFVTKMKHKEHIMRMRILKAQLKQLMRSKELLEMCKIGMENSFNISMNSQ